MDRSTDFLRDTAAAFHVHFVEVDKPKNGALSEVYFLDGKYVLRSRPMFISEEQLKEEAALLSEVRKCTKLQFPILRKTKKGAYSVEAGGAHWTLYEKIPGSVLGTWTNLPATAPSDRRAVLQILRAMHDATRGRMTQVARPTAYVERLRKALQKHRTLLSAHAQSRLALALDRAESMASALPKAELCFVHGDIHQGNVVVDEAKKIRGIVDCDDARIGHPFEDAGFTVMMYLRGYESDAFVFHEDWYAPLLQWYGVPAERHSLFADYLLLGALFDIDTFAEGTHIDRHAWFLQYQLSMVHDLCSRFLDSREALKAGLTPTPKFPVTLPDTSLKVAAELRLDPKDVSERFVRGSGHGGQKMNKTSSCVELHHAPSGVSVRVQEYREQHKNRIRAWKLLIDKIEEQMKGAESKRSREIFKIKKQKARRSRKSKEKMLKDKKIRGDLKKNRGGVR